MKRIFFLFGIVLLGVAFAITGAEMGARVSLAGSDGAQSFLISTWDVWKTVAPTTFNLIQDHPQVALIQSVLTLPGWILFGVPGLILVAVFRTRDANSLSDIEFQEHEESLYLIDKLAAEAEKEDYSDLPDDLSFTDPDDVVPAEAHYADDPVGDDLLPDRDFLLGPNRKS